MRKFGLVLRPAAPGGCAANLSFQQTFSLLNKASQNRIRNLVLNATEEAAAFNKLSRSPSKVLKVSKAFGREAAFEKRGRRVLASMGGVFRVPWGDDAAAAAAAAAVAKAKAKAKAEAEVKAKAKAEAEARAKARAEARAKAAEAQEELDRKHTNYKRNLRRKRRQSGAVSYDEFVKKQPELVALSNLEKPFIEEEERSKEAAAKAKAEAAAQAKGYRKVKALGLLLKKLAAYESAVAAFKKLQPECYRAGSPNRTIRG